VPETLLKKRKSQEKERAEKSEQREQKKKVSHIPAYSMLVVMISTNNLD